MVHNTRTEHSKDYWCTPPEFFNIIDKKYNFDVDLTASDKNHLCKEYYTKETNGLLQDLRGKRVYCNPPYNEKELWMKKCYEEGLKDNTIVVLLIPAFIETEAFHKYCMKAYKIYFIKGRIQFLINGKRPYRINKQGKKIIQSNNVGSVLVIFKKHNRKFPKLRPFYHTEKDLIKKQSGLEAFL